MNAQILFAVVLVLASASAKAYEDLPFKFNVEIPDSVLFVWCGEEVRSVEFEYFPGIQEIFLNGEPVFNRYIALTDENCWRRFAGNEVALGYLESGLSCSETYSKYENDQNVLLWDIANWIEEPEQLGLPDWLLTIRLCGFVGESPLKTVVKRALVIGGQPFLKFVGEKRPVRVRMVEERPGLGTSYIPFREGALSYSKRMVRNIKRLEGRSCIFAVGCSGFSEQTVSGDGIVEQGRVQIEAVKSTGEYVEGPIALPFFNVEPFGK
jgi:hypothetical protein